MRSLCMLNGSLTTTISRPSVKSIHYHFFLYGGIGIYIEVQAILTVDADTLLQNQLYSPFPLSFF